MSYFINYIRVLATILITNSHYSLVWPSSSMAFGGLLGNILFFAASGFCLYKIKENFPKWFAKMFFRIYPAMIVFTLVAVAFNKYDLCNVDDFVRLFVYPTNYPFLVYLMISYVVFYLLAWLDKKYNKTIETSLLAVVIFWIIIYLTFVDKSTYHVDDVTNPFILFLYFTSMLLGATFKKYTHRYNHIKWYNVVLLFVSLIVYFASKFAFSKWQSIAQLQILNQFSIILSLYFVFAVFIGLEKYLQQFGKIINGTIKFIANITLQIYIVQFLIIYKFQHLVFPLNFFVVTCLILVSASLLYYAEFFVRKGIGVLIKRIKRKENHAESSN